MADHVIRTQERHGRQHREASVGQVDPFQPQSHVVPISEVAYETRYVTPIGTEAFGSTIEFHLPLNAMLGEVWLHTALGAMTSGNYADYAGSNLIDRVELRSGNNMLMDFGYAPVLSVIQSRMTSEARTEFKAALGGASMASGNVISPLPMFWTKCANSYQEPSPPPLNSNLASSKLVLRIKLRTAAQIAAAGATVGSPTLSCRLYFQELVCTPALRNEQIAAASSYLYSGYDWESIESRFTVATATSTVMDISDIHGSIAELFFLDTLVTDVSTAHEYLNVQNDISALKLLLDNKEYQVIEYKENLRYEQLLMAGRQGIDSDWGAPVSMQLGLGYDGPAAWTGGLERSALNKLNAQITHGAGANCYVNVVARCKAYWSLQGGAFTRSR
jgi:hypothetical protein